MDYIKTFENLSKQINPLNFQKIRDDLVDFFEDLDYIGNLGSF